LPTSERPLPAVIVERGREPEAPETYTAPKRPARTVELTSAPDASNEAAVLAAGSQLAQKPRSLDGVDPKSPAAFVKQMKAYLAGSDDGSAPAVSLTIQQPADQLTARPPVVIPGGANVKMNIPDSAEGTSSLSSRAPVAQDEANDPRPAVAAPVDLSNTEVAHDPAGIERLEIDARTEAFKKREASKQVEQEAAVQQGKDRREQIQADSRKEAQRRSERPEADEDRRERQKPSAVNAP
jgi:hypothetical protein